MTLKFTKMHGLGNDFVVIDAIHQQVALSPARVRALADRRYGIGCDQLLLVEPAQASGAEFRYRIFNADGSEVEQCGNGARCFARFVHDQGLTRHTRIPVETRAGLITLSLQPDGQVRVDMGLPRLQPADLPFLAEQAELVADGVYRLHLDGETLEFGIVSMGNPHAVLRVQDLDHAGIGRLGPALQAHPAFPAGVNVGFMQVLDPGHIRLRVYERGAGETLACGTGACAAVVSGRQRGWLQTSTRVELPGGELVIDWPGAGGAVQMTGPATRVFDGQTEL